MSGQTPDHSDSLTTGQSLNSGASTRWAATSDSLSSRDGVFLHRPTAVKLGAVTAWSSSPSLGAGQGSSTGTTTYTDLQPGTGLAPLYTLSNRQGNSHSGFGRPDGELAKRSRMTTGPWCRLGTGANESRSDSLATNSGGRPGAEHRDRPVPRQRAFVQHQRQAARAGLARRTTWSRAGTSKPTTATRPAVTPRPPHPAGRAGKASTRRLAPACPGRVDPQPTVVGLCRRALGRS